MRIGQGYDVHRLVTGRPLILGGVMVDYDKGLDGHSDADVLLHSICDALLGAAALGDIGQHFPDSDASLLGVDSRVLLRNVAGLLSESSYNVLNIDATIVAQKPKLSSYIMAMRENIAADLSLDIAQINIKATTTEQLGFEGKGEGIGSQAIALINQAF